MTSLYFLRGHTYSNIDAQVGIEAILPSETFGQGEAWSESWLNVETDDFFLTDDTIFGFFAQA